MATNQALRQGIYEGTLYIFLTAGEAMEPHDVVMLDADNEGEFLLCTSTGVPFGFVAEKVTTSGVDQAYPNGLITHTAAVGDVVGVYICGGVYNHIDPTSANYGVEVYAGSTTAGKLSESASTSAVKVGIVTLTEDTDGICKVKSYL